MQIHCDLDKELPGEDRFSLVHQLAGISLAAVSI